MERAHRGREPVAEALPLLVRDSSREHLLLELVDRCVARREHPPPSSRERGGIDAPVVRVRVAARSGPSVSSASMTSLIDCGVMYARRASCAFESPPRAPRTLSVVYWSVVRP